jgi:hypothetical protein
MSSPEFILANTGGETVGPGIDTGSVDSAINLMFLKEQEGKERADYGKFLIKLCVIG